jgi:hypothetical protein
MIDDVDKLDHIEDGFVHYQLLRFCHATRLQYLNSHVSLDNQLVMQQQHVDYKIAEALLKRGTNSARQTWALKHRAWVDMVIHLPHDHGGFGITSNVISCKAALYTATARFIAFVGTLPLPNQSTWLADTLTNPSTLTSPPLLAMRSIHEELLANYDCTEDQPSAQHGGSAPAQQPNQTGSSQLSEDVKLSLPQLSRLHEAYLQRSWDRARRRPPSRHPPSRTPRPRSSPHSAAFGVTRQIIKKWGPYAEVKDKFNSSSRHKEQLSLHCPQKIAATDVNSTLREEMRALEPAEENAQPRTLRWVPLGFLGKIGPRHHADSWHLSLWQTFFCSTIGERIPVLVTLPTQSHPGATCGCNKFLLDLHGDHISTCKSHSGATKAHDWMVTQLGPLFGTTGHIVET